MLKGLNEQYNADVTREAQIKNKIEKVLSSRVDVLVRLIGEMDEAFEMSYEPETPWAVEENLVYNLRDKSKVRMRNDVAVSIEMRHLPEDVQFELAIVICNALNSKYFSDLGYRYGKDKAKQFKK